MFFVTAQEYKMDRNIEEGWNLVYGMIYLEQIQEESQITKGDIQAIYAYAPKANKYAMLYPEPTEEDVAIIQREDDDYLAQAAFWIYSTKRGTLKYKNYDPYVSIEGREVYSGWNILGITPDMVESPTNPTLTLEDIKGDCNVEKAYF
jgi:hypothetical protein